MCSNLLQAGAVCSRLQTVLGMKQPIPLEWLRECQTIKALAARLADAVAGQSLERLPPLKATISVSSDGVLETPLSFKKASVALSAPSLIGVCCFC